MKKEIFDPAYQGETKTYEVAKYVSDTDFAVTVIDRQIEKSKTNIKGAPIIIAGGYGVGSKENFQLLYDLASVIGAKLALHAPRLTPILRT
jgi:electron transfer flavoprotein alpha subunit